MQQEYVNGIWLRHADFIIDLKKLQETRIDGTGLWFFKTDQYKAWRINPDHRGPNKLFWVQGRPGSGKSTLASQIIQDLEHFEDSTVLYVFCKDGDENKNSLDSVLRNLAFQLLEKSSQRQAMHQIVQAARLNEKTPHAQSRDTLWTLFQRMLERTDQVFCVLDGLDECRDTVAERRSFLRRLTQVFQSESIVSNMMIISRLDLEDAGDDSRSWKYFQIQPSDVRDDVERFALTGIQNSRVLHAHPGKASLINTLVDNADGMILWAKLMIEELESGHWNIQSVLRKPPRGLATIYNTILHRISRTGASAERVQRALQLVLAAARPLRLQELAMGVAVIEGLSSQEDYDSRGDATAEAKGIVLESNPLFVIMPDQTVQLSHSSLKDYLLDPNFLHGIPAFQFDPDLLHNVMASALVSYMEFQCFANALEDGTQSKYFLLEYASLWLVHHSTRAGKARQYLEKSVAFFKSSQGWRWLQRLTERYGLSYGDLQLLQSQLKAWVNSMDTSCAHLADFFCDFLLVLARNRYEESKASLIDNLSILPAMDNLGILYQLHGQYHEAEQLFVQVMETRKRVLGQDHPDTLTSMGKLASTSRNQGRWTEAEQLEVQVMETRKRVLGQEHPHTLTSMANLASTYWNQGRWTEAEQLEVQVMETRKRVLGQEHPDTLTSMANLASTYRNKGRWTEAEQLFEQVMETRKRVLGQEHPDTLTSMANLASTYRNKGRWTEAEQLDVQVMEMSLRVLGQEHPDTLTSMGNLAATYRNKGRWTEAEQLEVQVMGTSLRVLGQEHPHTLTSMANLASTYWNQGRWTEAEQLEVQVMETRKRVLGQEHPDTLTSMGNLASTYRNKGRWTEAEQLFEQVMETRKRVVGQKHPDARIKMPGSSSPDSPELDG